jgi:hypothetical protein
MEAQDGIYVVGKILVDRCGSRYCTYKNFNRRLGKVGSEGEEHNPVMYLIFNIIGCVRGSYSQGIMG